MLHFFTGFHPQYHRPSDDISLLNIDGMRQVTSMVVGMIEQLANAKERPKRAVAADNVEQGTGVTINQLLTNGNTPRNTTRNALLGIVPVEEAGVVKIEQVVKGSGAALAGIRIGDEIVKLGETKIKSQRQLVEVVRSQKPGTKVTIQIRRNGILLELDVTL